MKKTFIILLLLPFLINAQPGVVIRNDTIFSFDPTTLVYIQLTKLVPSQSGQNGKVIGSNGTSYIWVTPFDGAYNSLTGKPDLTAYLLKTDSGRLASNYSTGGILKKVTDSIIAVMTSLLSGKQATITLGTTLQYFKGDLSLATFPTTTASFSSSTDKNFVTDAQLVNIGNTSGVNTGNQTITLTGDVSGSGTGSFAVTIGATKVTNTMLAGSIAYSKLTLTGAILNADLAGSIAYGKLSLTGAILNADLAGSIAYSKLTLTGAILNADLAGSIAYSKLSLTGAILNADLAGSIAYAKLTITGAILNADLAGSITESKLSITDLTTGNASTSAHGFMPKADNNSLHFYRSDGTQATPTGVNSTITFLSGDVTNNNGSANTIADVTGLSFAVTSGVTYRFKFFIVYTSAATTTGSRWAINGPSTTFVNYTSRYTLTATSETVNYIAAYDSPAASNASSLTSGNIAVIEGIIKPSANGTVIARFASEISASAIVAKAGQSFVEFQAIN